MDQRRPSDQSLRVACVGEAMIELSFPTDGDATRVGFAGDTLNTAIYLKRHLGAQHTVAFVSVLGTDTFSEQMINFIASENLSTDYISRLEARLPGLYAITTDSNGERSFSYWRDNSAAKLLFQTDGPASLAELSTFDVVFFSAITLAILPLESRELLFDWLHSYRQQPGKTVVFDSNYRPRLWRSLEEAQSAIARAWSLTDLGLPSVDDEMTAFGDSSVEAAIQRLRSYGLNKGVLKCAADGPRSLGTEHISLTFSSAPVVVDTTAAGDSFNGAFLAAHLRGKSLEDAMQAGHNCACEVIGHNGAIIPRSD